MSFVSLLIMMLTNGVFFLPPSEFILLIAFESFPSSRIATFSTLALVNTAGHFILFCVVRSYKHKASRLHSHFGSPLSKPLATLSSWGIDLTTWGSDLKSCFYLRLVPIAKTGVSISAALGEVSFIPFLVATACGNFLFCALWYCYFVLLSNFVSDVYFVMVTIVSVALVYFAHAQMTSRK